MGNSLNPFSGTSDQKEKRGQRSKASTDSSSNGNSGQFMAGPYSMGLNAALQGKKLGDIDYSAGLPPELRSPQDSLENGGGGDALEYACSSVQGRRAAMEDEHLALPAFVPRGAGNGAGVSLFGVFDGHGGRHCATFLNANMSDAVRRCLDREPNIEAALKMAFRELDEAFLA
eukprot:CAMPEP_0172175270 /NCGR_PEP_ID=MMETSP1050-20130122/14129_1 /TAXON_ID=233186 /ORGANISM="Cryptomonas curvata, Strain CCAP979/52" /LENGTH=172 /DNA_ID=CAMNT_0012847343 /DNA_START=138 /DNA_END=652 /DNA_ORIENTATION=-